MEDATNRRTEQASEVCDLVVGIDASQRALGEALLAELRNAGYRAAGLWQDDYRFRIDVADEPWAPTVIVDANDEYFDPDTGGQTLVSAYPLSVLVHGSTALIDTVLQAISSRLWPALRFSASRSSLIAAYLRTGRPQLFDPPLAVSATLHDWDAWLVEAPEWPVLEDKE